MEVAELVESFQFKPWRNNTEEVIDRENLKREIVDCCFFLVHIADCFEIRPQELDKKFEEVLANNERRYHGNK
jgi:NTP pyrophosphatase (non-canonical NTP hydrolase)